MKYYLDPHRAYYFIRFNPDNGYFEYLTINNIWKRYLANLDRLIPFTFKYYRPYNSETINHVKSYLIEEAINSHDISGPQTVLSGSEDNS